MSISIDFHIHSKYSFDCFLEPALIIEKARAAGLDGLAVTDHDTMDVLDGVDEFRRLAPDLLIIPGQEISTRQGDVLGLFLEKAVASHPQAEVVVNRIRSQGGLAILAHPFKWPHVLRSEAELSLFDGIEVFNARNNIPVPFLENHPVLLRAAFSE